jgi:hypothetical protein
MKKMISIPLVLFLLVMVVACGEADELDEIFPPIETQNTSQSELGQIVEHGNFHLQIASANDELLSGFSYLHEVDYAIVHEARGFFVESDVNLVVWSNTYLRDFALLSFTICSEGDQRQYLPVGFPSSTAFDTFGKIPELVPGQAFVINSYFGLGTLPGSGITFIDESGESRYFAFMQNQGYGDGDAEPWLIWEFENRALELDT